MMGADQAEAPSTGGIIDDWAAQQIRFVRFELPDMHGTSRSKLIPIDQAKRYAETGLNMYGGTGVLDTRSDVVPRTLYNEEVGYADQRLFPDPRTAAIVPWADGTARFICDAKWDDDTPLAALPRHVFQGVLKRCHDMGYECLFGFEPEFYLLDGESRQPLFSGYHIFNTVRNTYVPFIQVMLEQLAAAGLQVITANTEYAGSQWEVNFTPAKGINGPDQAFTFKNAIKELAHLHGYIASFMSKPFPDGAGSGCHAHVSLVHPDSGENLFADADDPDGISQLGRQCIAGQLRHARAAYALLAPTVNCLKRRRTHTFSPTNISWGTEDRSALIRWKGGSLRSRHVEHRAPSGMSNPYLVAAVILAAGLKGIEDGLELEHAAERPAEEDASKPPLPVSVRDSLDELQSDKDMVDWLGQEFMSAYVTMRQHELQRFDDHISDWELEEYLEIH